MPLALAGATSGSTTLQATDAVTATLTLPSATGTLLSTANPQSGGVIQVVQGTYSTEVSSSSGSYVTTNLTGTITPKFSTSKVLVITSMQISRDSGTSNNSGMNLQLQRNGTAIETALSLLYTNTNLKFRSMFAYSYLDSPASSSAVTYTWYMAQQNAGDIIYANTNNTQSTIILLEIAA